MICGCFFIAVSKTVSSNSYNLFKISNDCIDTKGYLGTKINQFGINTSSWISHSIEEARLCSHMASCIQVDSKKAYKMGLMHDYGRKYNHGGLHITLGFEHLYDLGYIEEAIGCLTHSFLNGNYYACFAPKNKEVDNKELYDFLQMYEYDSYDLILNLADLMATAEGIVPP